MRIENGIAMRDTYCTSTGASFPGPVFPGLIERRMALIFTLQTFHSQSKIPDKRIRCVTEPRWLLLTIIMSVWIRNFSFLEIVPKLSSKRQEFRKNWLTWLWTERRKLARRAMVIIMIFIGLMTDGGVEGVVAMQEYILCERCCAREPLDANLNYTPKSHFRCSFLGSNFRDSWRCNVIM